MHPLVYHQMFSGNDELLADCRKRRKAAILRVSQMMREPEPLKTEPLNHWDLELIMGWFEVTGEANDLWHQPEDYQAMIKIMKMAGKKIPEHFIELAKGKEIQS